MGKCKGRGKRTVMKIGGALSGGICHGGSMRVFPLIVLCSPLVLSVAFGYLYEEQDGLVSVEAEHFANQALDDVRRWFVVSETTELPNFADVDTPHVAGARGGQYIEILPDTRTNHDEPLVQNENFTNTPGKMAVLAYPVYFHNPGRYFIWGRAFSTGTEDNGAHFGLNGTWPESGQRLQLCEGKHQWTWSSAQRRPDNHCGEPLTLWLDIDSPGMHTILVSMREDGFELDTFILTSDPTFVPEGESIAPTFRMPKPIPEKTTFVGIDHYSRIFHASEQFTPRGAVPYYHDKGRNVLAINAAKPELRNRMAYADYEYPFKRENTFDLILVTLAETDGESDYEVKLNGEVIGSFKNPETSTDYAESYFLMEGVSLKEGDRLTVGSNAVTNGKIPEGDGTAFSRGRWRGLVLQRIE